MAEKPTMAAETTPLSRGKRGLATIALLYAVVGATIYASYGSGGPGIENIDFKEQKAASALDADDATNNAIPLRLTGRERLLASEPETGDREEALIEKIAEKLQPTTIRFFGDEEGGGELEVGEIKAKAKGGGDNEEKPTLLPHQFLHLHHMKTGGTSIDKLLRCSINRLKKEANYNVPYYSIHECSRSHFAKCLTEKDNDCRSSMDKASVMSYCAALKYLDEFGWWHNNKDEENKVKAFTVLRHPVDRVWSMFRFQTKNCYKCQPLKDIYEKFDRGEDTGVDKLCMEQLQNHEVNNLLSSEWPVEVSKLDIVNEEEHFDISGKMVQEAIDNMKGFFTVIGMTEHLPETAETLGKVFPWMNLDGNDLYGTTSQCELPHANASPKNNRCGKDNTHWDLPKQPDQETYDLIVKHNQMDMDLYEAALAYFELQQKALSRR